MYYYFFPISGFINALTSFSLGFFVLLKNPKSELNKRFFYFAFSVGSWAIFYSFWLLSRDAKTAKFLVSTAMIGASLIPAAFIYFVYRFLNIKNRLLNYLNIFVAFFLASSVYRPFFIESVERKLYFNFWPVPGYLFNVMVAFFVGNLIYAQVVLWKAMNSAKGLRKSQIKYVFIGMVIGFIGGITNYFLWYDIPIPPYLNFMVSGYMLCVAYSIVRHHLMDIEVIIKRTLVFAGLFTAVYAIFSAFAYLGSLFFENIVSNRLIALIPSVFITVLMLRPLEVYLQNITERYLFQKKYDYKDILKTFTDEVLTVLNMAALSSLTVNKLTSIMKLKQGAMLLRIEDTEQYIVSAYTGISLLEEMYVECGSELFVRITEKGYFNKALDYKDGDELPEDITRLVEILRAEMIIPLEHNGAVLGILTLGMKRSDEEFNQDDIDILLPLARTLAIAITNAKLLENVSQAQAQAAQREKMAVIGTLSAGINHEICNPLGIIRGQCEVFLLNLRDGVYKNKKPEELVEKAEKIMEKVINETDRATGITKKLSSFSKPATGKIEENVSVLNEINEVESLLSHDLKINNIMLVKNIPEDLPEICADRKQIQEIFFNLVRNAAQAIKNEGTIEVLASKRGSKVLVEIKDTGIGMSRKQISHMFNPFFTTKEPGKGTGLGLFIVKQVVERNKGSIYVESSEGKGTTFFLEFMTAPLSTKNMAFHNEAHS